MTALASELEVRDRWATLVQPVLEHGARPCVDCGAPVPPNPKKRARRSPRCEDCRREQTNYRRQLELERRTGANYISARARFDAQGRRICLDCPRRLERKKGKDGVYRKWPLRCPRHQAAVRAAALKRARERRLERTRANGGIAPLPPERHGKYATYCGWNCQCEPCKKASADREGARRGRVRVRGPRKARG